MESIKQIKADLNSQRISLQEALTKLEKIKAIGEFDLFMESALLVIEIKEAIKNNRKITEIK